MATCCCNDWRELKYGEMAPSIANCAITYDFRPNLLDLVPHRPRNILILLAVSGEYYCV